MTADKLPLDAKALDAGRVALMRCTVKPMPDGRVWILDMEQEAAAWLRENATVCVAQARAALALAAQVERLEALLKLAVEWMQEDGCDCGSDDPRCTLCEAKATLASTSSDALASLRAQVRADALREAAEICSRQESCETDLGPTYCEERYAAAILAAANAQGETK